MSRRALSSMSDAELQQELKDNRRRYWYVFGPLMALFFVVIGIAFGVRALFGVYPFLAVGGLDLIVIIGMTAAMMVIGNRQLRVGFEIRHRAREAAGHRTTQ